MSIIQITKSGAECLGTDDNIKSMHAELVKQCCIKLPSLLEPRFLKHIQNKINQAEFFTLSHYDSGNAAVDLRMKNNSTHNLLHGLINEKQFLNLIEKITGCNEIKYFRGRVYRMIPGHGHYDDWHTDVAGDRVLTMSINLSTDIYSGGILQIRDKKTKNIICEVSNTVPGDAMIFPISSNLEHMITNTEGNIPKTAFAGWFSSKIDYKSFTQKKSLQLPENINETSLVHENLILVALKGLLCEEVDEKHFIFNPIYENGFELNPLGAAVWDLLQKPITPEKIQKHILREYEADPRQCKYDILNLLNEMATNGLIVIIDNENTKSYAESRLAGLTK